MPDLTLPSNTAVRPSELQSLVGYPVPGRSFNEIPRDEFSRILDVLKRRCKTLVTIFVAFVSLVIGLTLATPKSYTTTAKLIVGEAGNQANSDTQLPVLNALTGIGSGRSPETYVELIQETPVAQRVIDDLQLNTTPSALLGSVRAKPITNTTILDLAVTWSSPQRSAQIANAFASIFVDRERELISSQAGSALSFLSSKLGPAEEAMNEAERELAAFEAAHTKAYINSQTQAALSTVSAVDARIGQVEVDRGQAGAQLREIARQMETTARDIDSSASVNENPVVASLRIELAQVDTQLRAAQRQYTELHPTVIALRGQKASLESQIAQQPSTIVAGHTVARNPTYEHLDVLAASLRDQVASDDAQLRTLKTQLTSLTSTVQALPAESLQLADLQRKTKLAEAVYTTVQQRYNDSSIAQAVSLSDVAITQPASAALAAVQPDLKLNTMLAVLVGLVLGVCGVFIIEFFDNTYKNERDVKRDLPLPVLASIPKLPAGNARYALPWLRALTVDTFMQIVTSLRYSSDRPLRSLAITSPQQGDGKSTLALNIAMSLAEMGPAEVLLVEADLRRPNLHWKLGLFGTPGLSDALVCLCDVMDAIQLTKHKGLHFLAAGPAAPNPIKLFQSEHFKDIMLRLTERYGIVIFDTPPLQHAFEGALISAQLDGTVMVVSAGKTDSQTTKAAIERLTSIGSPNIIGIILNQTAPPKDNAGYYRRHNASFELAPTAPPDEPPDDKPAKSPDEPLGEVS